MRGIKRMLLGIAVMLLGAAIGAMNFLAWRGGALGFPIVLAGLFTHNKDE